jgi:hypothetical protein
VCVTFDLSPASKLIPYFFKAAQAELL